MNIVLLEYGLPCLNIVNSCVVTTSVVNF
uniref:Uncharacterized protein n=1 Tax=Anguilla anguilla TaxID=7936 RepID=A0A0E9PSJ8_ANGAN